MLAAAVAAVAAGRSGDRASALDLDTAWAWFASPTTGTVALIDGPTATRVERVTVAEPGDDIEVVQAGPHAYVLNRTAATLRRVDGASFSAGPTVALAGVAGGQRAAVAAGDGAAWALGGGVVQPLHPEDLTLLGRPLPFPGTVSSSATSPDATLWAVGPGGEVRSYAKAGAGAGASLAGVADPVVVLAGDRPVVVDAARRRAVVLDPATARSRGEGCMDLAPDAFPVVSGSGPGSRWVLVVSGTAGRLLVSDVVRATCQLVLLGDAAPGHEEAPRYGAAVEHDGLVFVPDHTAGTAVVVDPLRAEAVLGRVELGLANTRFRLFSHHGFVWFDDPAGDRAGVITPELRAIAVSKTSQEDTTGVPVGPDVPAPPPRVSCTATPRAVEVGQEVAFTATTELDPPPQRFTWSFPGAAPSQASGPTARAVWSSQGRKEVAIEAEADGQSHRGSCQVAVGEVPAPEDDDEVVSEEPTDVVVVVPPHPDLPTQPPAPALAPSFSTSPNPAVAGEPVAFVDTTEGPHLVDGWRFDAATPDRATTTEASVTWPAPGTYTVVLTVTRDGAAFSTQAPITVNPPGGLTVVTDALPAALRGQAYSATLAATGGLAPYTWSWADERTHPAGFGLGPDGALTGTPTTAGTTRIGVRVTDAAGQSAERSLDLVVTKPAAVWRPSGTMTQDRVGHSATLLGDGRVLVAGGQGGPVGLTSAEVFDPATNSWSPTGSMQTSRYGHKAVLLQGPNCGPNCGKVLVTSMSLEGPVWEAELYDPVSGTWAPTSRRRSGSHGIALTALPDGSVLSAGGHGPGACTVESAEIYKPDNGTWTSLAPMATRRNAPTATVLPSGKVLVAGGHIIPNCFIQTQSEFLATTEIFDPASGSWSPGPEMNVRRAGHWAQMLTGGRILVTGGSDAELFDPVAGSWTLVGSLGVPRSGLRLVAIDSGVLVAGGLSGSTPLADAEVFSPTSLVWSPAPPMAAARSGHTLTVLSDGRVLAAGGGTASAEIYG